MASSSGVLIGKGFSRPLVDGRGLTSIAGDEFARPGGSCSGMREQCRTLPSSVIAQPQSFCCWLCAGYCFRSPCGVLLFEIVGDHSDFCLTELTNNMLAGGKLRPFKPLRMLVQTTPDCLLKPIASDTAER